MTSTERQERDLERVVDASPTEDLFIEMLTRDIALIPSIVDLVDNCADGARRVRGNDNYRGLWARLEISTKQFRLSDNCGGIPADIARDYAFRFGRPHGAPSVKHSVGQFGVGMKRAIFKMGKYFRVESTTHSTRFVIEQDVLQWAKDPKWEYEFSEFQKDGDYGADEQGTTVTVTQLNEGVAAEFGLADFATRLKQELKSKLRDPIARGLAVTINAIPVDSEPLTVLAGRDLNPAFKELRFPPTGPKPVLVKLYCGLGASDDPRASRAAAGWHVFCNGRLILEGDKTAVTGWGEDAGDVSIPAFHGQYNNLRGYAYFDCDDPSKLPWNTTKTGFNADSPLYRAVRLEMMRMMLPVKAFLDRLKEEKSAKSDTGEAGPLESLLLKAEIADVQDVAVRRAFELPPMKQKRKPAGPIMQKIQYEKPLKMVEEAKNLLKARSWKEVGEKTFDYFYRAEVAK